MQDTPLIPTKKLKDNLEMVDNYYKHHYSETILYISGRFTITRHLHTDRIILNHHCVQRPGRLFSCNKDDGILEWSEDEFTLSVCNCGVRAPKTLLRKFVVMGGQKNRWG